ncbi:MAG: hypothetical protein ABII90_06920 [Bacteroidota bacterium]
MTKFAKVISFLFHPLIMPIFGLYLVFNTDTYLTYSVPPLSKKIVYLVVFIFTILLPVINAIFLMKKGTIRSLNLETIKERKFPYVLAIVYYCFAYFFLKQIPLPPIVYMLILGAILSIIIAFIINLRWKISMHMIGIGGVLGAMIGISQRFMVDISAVIMLLILCAGFIGFSRLKLNAHCPAQIYTGFFLGIISVLIMILGV